MILPDTNVLSALMQRDPDAAIIAWLDGLPPESVWTTSATVFEVRFGLEAAGRRRRRLDPWSAWEPGQAPPAAACCAP